MIEVAQHRIDGFAVALQQLAPALGCEPSRHQPGVERVLLPIPAGGGRGRIARRAPATAAVQGPQVEVTRIELDGAVGAEGIGPQDEPHGLGEPGQLGELPPVDGGGLVGRAPRP